MGALGKRWYRSRRNQVLMITFILGLLLYSILKDNTEELDLDLTKSTTTLNAKKCRSVDGGQDCLPVLDDRISITAYIERKLEEQLKLDKGTGCEMPVLDPFAAEVTQFDKDLPKVTCEGQDWVKCYLSECRVVKEILDKYVDVTCVYEDIIYVNDDRYDVGGPVEVAGADVYRLARSDHARVACRGGKSRLGNFMLSKWSGHVAGFRNTAPRPLVGGQLAANVLIFGFDSTARNGFIRRMPHSYRYLTEQLDAEVLEGYNILGDGTPAALFPILTGKNELELPDARKKSKNNKSVSDMPFIFFKLKEEGYRTAYFEDMPWIGTFQYRFNGFRHQPADHYLRAFFQEQSSNGKRWWNKKNRYCVGDTPQYKLMMNLTNQFFHLDGKKFAFTFIADITHDDFNMIPTADDDFVDFLKAFKNDGFLEDTLLLVMGDHGPRYANVRNTFQGKLEERLPLMAVALPPSLRRARPRARQALRQNARALTTAHDVHATVLDALALRALGNPHRVAGADLPRALSLLEPIPRNRSCSEAGIESHWCACLSWRNVTRADPLHGRAAEALVSYINGLTQPVRARCAPRALSAVRWVLRQQADGGMLAFAGARDPDGYVGKFGDQLKPQRETYQVKLTVDPGAGDFEASMIYHVDSDKFHIDTRDISRTNMYGSEPDCISKTHPHLNPYCYCAH